MISRTMNWWQGHRSTDWLCDWFGWHVWAYFRQARSFEELFPDDRIISRRCRLCGRMQCTDGDGARWQPRL